MGNVEASNMGVQDGFHAGQSVPHVHVHILPRKVNDFERNDDVYDHLDNWNMKENRNKKNEKLNVPEHRNDRTFQEMADEANSLRKFMESGHNILFENDEL